MAWGGEQILGVDGKHNGWIEEAGTAKAGEGEDDGVEFAVAEFVEAGVDVASDRLDGKIGAGGEQLRAATETAGANAGGSRQILDGSRGGRNNDIAGVFPLRDGGGDQIGLIDQRHGDGDILEAVDSEIDFVSEEGLFEFLGEEAFAAGFVERAVGDAVAGGFDGDEFDLQIGMKPHQLGGDEIALGQGE